MLGSMIFQSGTRLCHGVYLSSFFVPPPLVSTFTIGWTYICYGPFKFWSLNSGWAQVFAYEWARGECG